MPPHSTHWLAHAGELRRRLLVSLVFFIVMTLVAFLWAQPLLSWLTRDVSQKLQFLSPTDVLWVYMTLAAVSALVATIPFVCYQLWRFVSPGLTRNEKRATLKYVPALAILFVAGLCFGYFVVYPTLFGFLTRLSGDQFLLNYTAEHYLRFLLHMTLPFGVIFEMPVLCMFLTRLRIINPKQLASMRKVAYFVLTIVAVSLTPPDIVSDLLVAVPLIGLYEISITMARFVQRRMDRATTATDMHSSYVRSDDEASS